jgi:hypothetical protein
LKHLSRPGLVPSNRASTKPGAIQTVFALGFLASLAWLGVEGRRWRKRPKLEDVVNEVMKSSDRLP